MRIGFDLDGVITEISIVNWLLMDTVKDKKMQELIKEFLHFVPKLKYHPQEFLHEGDEYIIITGRERRFWQVTERWLKNHGIQTSSVFYTDSGTAGDYKTIEDFFNAVADGKARYIKSECIDVYFEDSPVIVSKLRKLCPKVKIIQVGRRLR